MKWCRAVLYLAIAFLPSLMIVSCGGGPSTPAIVQLSITTSSLPPAIAGQGYNALVSASGGVAPYTWRVSSGSLPPGLSLGSIGSISGTPTVVGSFGFSLQATDSETTPMTSTAQLSITVSPAPLQITTTTLPAGAAGVPYSASLAAQGGAPPYTWSLTSGALPSGLTLDSAGNISGTPGSTGNFAFTVQAADSETPAMTTSAALSITIGARTLVTTERYDNFRSGQTLVETTLTPSMVASTAFRKLFSRASDGFVYAQPLYVEGVTIPGKGVHNVLYVATEHDTVFAWDADSNSGQNSDPLWQVSFLSPANGVTTVPSGDLNCDNLLPELGITSTPVIDIASSTLYVVAETKENGSYFQRLHALDLATGGEKAGSPVVINATYPGSGDGSSGGMLTFDPLQELNRPGLLLSQGTVYITWASNCDEDPFHGWVIGYDAGSLQQTAVWVDTPNGRRGGVWMSGGGMAADAAGNLYLASGNGTFETTGEPTDFGDSIIRLAVTAQGLSLADYFTPYDEATLDDNDRDLGSGGVLLLPDQPGPHVHELVEAGKEGTIYLVDRDDMGHFNPNDNSQIVQSLSGQVRGIFSVPTYWNGNVYLGGNGDYVKAFSLSDGVLSSTPTSQSAGKFTFPGASTSVSANDTHGGIVWAIQSDQYTNDGNDILSAFDATNLGNQLYTSTQNPDRDNPGVAAKFQTPVVVKGKVYVGAADQVSVYGISPQ